MHASLLRRTSVPTLAVMLAGWAAPAAIHARSGVDTRCIVASGSAIARCVRRYADAVTACRVAADTGCETALRAPGGKLATLLVATEKPVRDHCTPAAADVLNIGLGVDDVVSQAAQACERWGRDFIDTALADDLTNSSASTRSCQRTVAERLGQLRETVVHAYGRRCDVAEFAGRRCNRAERDRRIARARAGALHQIVRRCGATFDVLELVSSASGAMLEDRVDELANVVEVRSRHLALRAYPPLSLGATAFPGPHPVGVRTLALVDAARLNPSGTGPRALTTEVYYPSTAEAVAGVPGDIVKVLGVPLFPTPSFRDVARAPGTFPLLVYSPGSGEPRFIHLSLMLHLASHGYVVIGVDHEGNDLLSPSGDPQTLVNRPRDMSVLIDQFLGFDETPGHFLEGAIDADRIGAFGHSFGGYTVLALAAGPFGLGTFTDPRVKAIMPLDASPQVFEASGDAPGIFTTIHVPTLLFGGTLSPFLEPRIQTVFDTIPAGPTLVAFADLRDAGHGTFTDVCEVPDNLLLAFGGIPFECLPMTLPWRYARHLVDYLALNFFDATLNADGAALANLASARLATVEDIMWQAK